MILAVIIAIVAGIEIATPKDGHSSSDKNIGTIIRAEKSK